MCAVVWNVGFSMECGLFYGIRAAVYICCSICGLLNGMWAVVGYVGCCMVFRLLYVMWAVVWNVSCCVVCGLL